MIELYLAIVYVTVFLTSMVQWMRGKLGNDLEKPRVRKWD